MRSDCGYSEAKEESKCRYPDISHSLTSLSRLKPRFSSPIHSLFSVYPGLSTHYHHFICSHSCFTPCSPLYFTLACPIPSDAAPPLPSVWYSATLTTLPYHMLLTWLKQFVYQPFSTIPYCPRLPSCQKKFKYDYKHVHKFCSSIHPTLVQTKYYE